MLLERYLATQLKQLPESTGQFLDVARMRQIGRVKTLIVTTSSLLLQRQFRLVRYFSIQDQTENSRQIALALAASLAASGKLSLGSGIVNQAKEQGLHLRELEVDHLPGGLLGKLERTWYLLGDATCMQSQAVDLGVASQALASQLEAEGNQVLFLAQKQPKRLIAVFGLRRQALPEASPVLQGLAALGLRLILVSSERGVGEELGFDESYHEEVKADRLAALASRPHPLFICTAATVGALPTGALHALVGTKLDPTAALRVPNLEALVESLTEAQHILQRAKKRFFWAKL